MPIPEVILKAFTQGYVYQRKNVVDIVKIGEKAKKKYWEIRISKESNNDDIKLIFILKSSLTFNNYQAYFFSLETYGRSWALTKEELTRRYN